MTPLTEQQKRDRAAIAGGYVSRIPTGQPKPTASIKPKARPMPTRTTGSTKQRRAELLDLAIQMHKRITAAVRVAEAAGDTARLKHLKKAAKSASKAVNLLMDRIP